MAQAPVLPRGFELPLKQRLPRTTLVSIGHRSTLAAFHRRRLTLSREGDRFWLRDSGATAMEK